MMTTGRKFELIHVWDKIKVIFRRPNYKYPSTSQFAEIFAAEDAVRDYKKRWILQLNFMSHSIIYKWFYSGEDELQVRSDSAYLNDCMHTYIHKWLDNDWITAQGEFHLMGHPLGFKLAINDCLQGMKRFIVNHLKIFGSSWILSLLILFGLNEQVGFH